MSHYGLIGNNIQYSLSPFIHNRLFEARKKHSPIIDGDHTYQIFDANHDFNRLINQIKREKLAGFNVTIPYKESIISHLAAVDPLASLAGAVNTVSIVENQWIGYNTDGRGLVLGLSYRGLVVKGQRVLVLGAGGAARGIIATLLEAEVSSIEVHNRNIDNGKKLVEFFNSPQVTLHAESKALDILINTTPLGGPTSPGESPINLEGKYFRHVVDIIYKPLETPLILQGKALGLKTYGGLDMLFFQAVLAQDIWFGWDLERSELASILEEVTAYVANQP